MFGAKPKTHPGQLVTEDALPPKTGRRSMRLVLLALLLPAAPAFSASPPPCHAVIHEERTYTVCEVDLRRQTVRLFWKRPDGEPYRALDSLPHALDKDRGRLLFATNAGMFDAQYRPVGLYVEDGRELVRISMRPGPGNFHLKPNGVFSITGETAAVSDSDSFLRDKPQVDFATQSGPMLVIGGQLHPRFVQARISQKRRDGVGIRDRHTVVFAISEDPVSFAEFARLFRDALACRNALFLDGGSVPRLYSPLLHRVGNLLPMGPMIAVFDRDQESPR
jgi:uncharacterized protein YigE (DUF2233 family)